MQEEQAVIPGIDPKIDYAFKRLFGREQNRPLLIHLLNAVLQPPPEAPISSVEILNPFNDKEALDDKLSVVDIKARDQLGRQFDVEMQMVADQYFRGRAVYYWAKFHQQQLHEGQGYPDLHPTILICFVNSVLYQGEDRYHLRFQLRDETNTLLFSDHLAIHLLELPKYRRSAQEVVGPLDQWLYFLCHAADMDRMRLPAPLQVPEICRAMEDLEMISRNDLERERYEARVKLERDERSRLVAAKEKGLEEGLGKGLEKGLEKGLKLGLVDQIHLYQRLLKCERTPAQDLLAMSLAELRKLAAELDASLPQ